MAYRYTTPRPHGAGPRRQRGCACVHRSPGHRTAPPSPSPGAACGRAGVAGFGDLPLASAPLQASVFGAEQLADAGIASHRRPDAGSTPASATPTTPRATGASCRRAATRWTTASTTAATACRSTPRPPSRWTTRSALELLKGTSGIQAGTSAPGGLVNLVVKRPERRRARGALRGARAGLAHWPRWTWAGASAPTAPSACA